MSLKHAILGFLSISDKTGYDLQKKNEQTIQHFWPSTQSQIYRTLKELERDGLIKGEITIQREKPNKRLYALTPEGKQELVDWLAGPLDPAPHRNQFLVQLFFSKHISRDAICANLSHYRARLEARLEYLKSDEVRTKFALAASPKEEALFRIIVDNGIRLLEAEIGWVNSSILKIEELE
ncbi:MAG: PadR family transcriptional regulator [Anaerolineales bacterium]|nr:PadR family transcriptional regulator [Anaerolineales bacterium]